MLRESYCVGKFANVVTLLVGIRRLYTCERHEKPWKASNKTTVGMNIRLHEARLKRDTKQTNSGSLILEGIVTLVHM